MSLGVLQRTATSEKAAKNFTVLANLYRKVSVSVSIFSKLNNSLLTYISYIWPDTIARHGSGMAIRTKCSKFGWLSWGIGVIADGAEAHNSFERQNLAVFQARTKAQGMQAVIEIIKIYFRVIFRVQNIEFIDDADI